MCGVGGAGSGVGAAVGGEVDGLFAASGDWEAGFFCLELDRRAMTTPGLAPRTGMIRNAANQPWTPQGSLRKSASHDGSRLSRPLRVPAARARTSDSRVGPPS